MKAVSSALVKAKGEFGLALKDKTNLAFRSKYADLGACIEAVEDALLKQGIALMWKTHPDNHGVTVECVLLHESGESISSGPLHLPATKQDAQGFGSAMTYGRRYTLQAVCGIAAEDDDGNAAVKKPAKLEGPRGVANAVLHDNPVPEDRQRYLESLAGDIADEANNGRTMEALLDLIDKEIPDQGSVERIFLSTQMSSKLRNELAAASRARRK